MARSTSAQLNDIDNSTREYLTQIDDSSKHETSENNVVNLNITEGNSVVIPGGPL